MKTLYERLCESFFDNVGSPFEVIDNWCKDNISGWYEIDRETLIINAPSTITIVNKNLVEFPSYIHFGTVGGEFYCNNCSSLKSLKGVPREVGRSFYCDNCTSLKTLEGAPEKVGGNFNCSSCTSLKTLEGAPKEVGMKFYCDNCSSLTSLEGISPNIKGKIYSDIR